MAKKNEPLKIARLAELKIENEQILIKITRLKSEIEKLDVKIQRI